MNACETPAVAIAKNNIQQFLSDVERAIGSANVVKESGKVQELSRDPVFTTVPPVAFVYPSTTAEVSEIVHAANKYAVTIWPYSTGKNWGYCNTSGQANSVVVILNRMNKIHHVDYELAFAEIEPGVTYEQLNAYLRANNLRLWTDCTGGPPSGSVIGNALDRGVGVTPSGDHFANLCGLEVVLPNGNVIRTGGFSDAPQGAWHTYKWGIGPSLEGLFAQSNLGIVTKAGIWLMREPQDFVAGALKIDEPTNLGAALDSFRELMFQGVLPEKGRFSNDVAIFSLITQAANEGLAGLPLTKSARANLRRKYSVPAWTGSFGIYGTKRFVRMMSGEASNRLKRLGRVSLVSEKTAQRARTLANWLERSSGWFKRALTYATKRLFGVSVSALRLIPELLDIHKGIPNESVVRRAYFRYPTARPVSGIDVARDGLGVLWFVPLLPLRGAEIDAYVQDCEKRFEKHGIDFYVTIMILNARTAVPLMVLLYDLADDDSCSRAKLLYDELYEDALNRGYQQFRCAHLGWDRIFSDFPELQDAYQSLKDAWDPQHVIAQVDTELIDPDVRVEGAAILPDSALRRTPLRFD